MAGTVGHDAGATSQDLGSLLHYLQDSAETGFLQAQAAASQAWQNYGDLKQEADSHPSDQNARAQANNARQTAVNAQNDEQSAWSTYVDAQNAVTRAVRGGLAGNTAALNNLLSTVQQDQAEIERLLASQTQFVNAMTRIQAVLDRIKPFLP